MTPYTTKNYKAKELEGISKKAIEEHLKLYAGYVKHTNLILEKIEELSKDTDPSTPFGAGNAYVLGELQRRFGFEFGGMRNHEYYFSSLLSDKSELDTNSPLKKQIEKDFGFFEGWLARFKTIALTRGIGWAMLYWDTQEKRLINAWVDEQHLGQLADCKIVLALDMWEHSYLFDYVPADKKKYVEAFFSNLSWSEIEKNFKN